MSQTGNYTGPDPSAYKCNTLISNWFEERQLPAGPQGHQTSERCLSLDLRAKDAEALQTGRLPGMTYEGVPPPAGQLSSTTKLAMDAQRFESLAPVAPPRPSMYSSKNLDGRLKTYGVPDKMNYTLNGTKPRASDVDRHLQTTNDHFYNKLPAADLTTAGTGTKAENYFEPMDRTHFAKSTLRKDTYDTTRRQPTEDVAAGKGSRGEISRNPNESGNVYGVSVFVDEYAKWGTVLPEKNMSLSESVSKKTSKYF